MLSVFQTSVYGAFPKTTSERAGDRFIRQGIWLNSCTHVSHGIWKKLSSHGPDAHVFYFRRCVTPQTDDTKLYAHTAAADNPVEPNTMGRRRPVRQWWKLYNWRWRRAKSRRHIRCGWVIRTATVRRLVPRHRLTAKLMIMPKSVYPVPVQIIYCFPPEDIMLAKQHRD